jgi:hemolysin activation/secretion protein
VEYSSIRLCALGILLPVTFTLFAGTAIGQPGGLPGTADPGRIVSDTREDSFRQPAQPSLPVLQPDTDTTAVLSIEPSLLSSVEVRGATVYSQEIFRQIAAAYTGRTVAGRDLIELASKITALYQQDGYFLSRARLSEFEQDTGTALFDIIEGYIEEVAFIGSTETIALTQLNALAAGIVRDRPLRASVMEHYLYLMDDIPGIFTEASVEFDPDSAGSVLEVTVNHRAVSVTSHLNNRGSEYMGPHRLSVEVATNGLLGWNEELVINLLTVPADPEELMYGEVRWRQVLNSQGTQLNLGGSIYRSRPDIPMPAPFTGFSGSGNLLSVGIRHPLVRSREQNLAFVAGYNHEKSVALLEWSGADLTLYKDKIRSVVLGLSSVYTSGNTQITAAGSVTRGFNIFGAGDGIVNERSRLDGRSAFTAINLNASYRLRFSAAPHWSLYSSIAAQYSFHPLLVSEEFGLGGPGSVRAYDSSEFSGDSGVNASVELRFQPEAFRGVSGQVYGFYDAGGIRNRGTRPYQVESAHLTGAGAGYRFSLRAVDGFIEYAKPLKKSFGEVSSSSIFVGLSSRF